MEANHRCWFDRGTGKQAQPVALSDGRQDQVHLDHGEIHAHTTPWSLPEREVRTPCSVGTIRRESLRVKGRWTLPEIRVAVSKILTRKHQRSSRNVVATDL